MGEHNVPCKIPHMSPKQATPHFQAPTIPTSSFSRGSNAPELQLPMLAWNHS